MTALFLWGNVLFRQGLQINAINSNFANFESALYMKPESMPLTLSTWMGHNGSNLIFGQFSQLKSLFKWVQTSPVYNWFSASWDSTLNFEANIFKFQLLLCYSILLRGEINKIMHMLRFYASSAQIWKVSSMNKHENWRATALFCHNSQAQSKYAVVNLIHTWHKLFVFLLPDK